MPKKTAARKPSKKAQNPMANDPGRPDYPTITVGELRAQLARFPDDTPVRALLPACPGDVVATVPVLHVTRIAWRHFGLMSSDVEARSPFIAPGNAGPGSWCAIDGVVGHVSLARKP